MSRRRKDFLRSGLPRSPVEPEVTEELAYRESVCFTGVDFQAAKRHLCVGPNAVFELLACELSHARLGVFKLRIPYGIVGDLLPT